MPTIAVVNIKKIVVIAPIWEPIFIKRNISIAGIKINNHILRFENESHEPHPIWLNPGNYTIWLANGASAYPKTIGSISGIEFNLVP